MQHSSALAGLGFVHVSTGGNCSGYELTFRSLPVSFLITDGDACAPQSTPSAELPWVVDVCVSEAWWFPGFCVCATEQAVRAALRALAGLALGFEDVAELDVSPLAEFIREAAPMPETVCHICRGDSPCPAGSCYCTECEAQMAAEEEVSNA